MPLIEPLQISYYIGHYCHLKLLQSGNSINLSPSLAACIFSGTKKWQQKEGFGVRSSFKYSASYVSNVRCLQQYRLSFKLREATKSNKNSCIVLGVNSASLMNQSEGVFHAWYWGFVSPLFLWELLSVQVA